MVDYIIDAEILQPVFELIDEKVSTQDERGTVKRSIMDVLNAPKGLVSIDINDVRDLFLESYHPLLMEELQPFSEWIESVPDDFLIRWGMATQSTQEIRAIVLLQ